MRNSGVDIDVRTGAPRAILEQDAARLATGKAAKQLTDAFVADQALRSADVKAFLTDRILTPLQKRLETLMDADPECRVYLAILRELITKKHLAQLLIKKYTDKFDL